MIKHCEVKGKNKQKDRTTVIKIYLSVGFDRCERAM